MAGPIFQFEWTITLGQAGLMGSIVGGLAYLHRTLRGIGVMIWQHQVMWNHHRRSHSIPPYPATELMRSRAGNDHN